MTIAAFIINTPLVNQDQAFRKTSVNQGPHGANGFASENRALESFPKDQTSSCKIVMMLDPICLCS